MNFAQKIYVGLQDSAGMTMKCYLLICCMTLSVLPFELSAAQDENGIFYECYARSLAGKFESSRNHCQCQNDMALKIMSPTDWDRFSKDYDAFSKLLSSASKYEPNSYGKSLALINDSCIACKNRNKNYKGCLRSDPDALSPEKAVAIATNLRFGQFDLVARDAAYSQVFMDVVSTYSDYCRANIAEGTRYWSEDQYGRQQGKETIIDHRYTEAFERHASRSSMNFFVDVVGEGARALLEGEIPSFGLNRGAMLVVVDQAVRGYVGDSCHDQSALTRVYKNLNRYERGQSPLLVPGGEKERVSWGANDTARLHALVEFHKQDKAAQDAKRLAEGPLRCELAQTMLASSVAEKADYYQGGDHGGSYVLQLNNMVYEMAFYSYSMVRDYGSKPAHSQAVGFAYETSSGCSYNMVFGSANSMSLRPTRESNVRTNNGCSEEHGYVRYGSPGEPVQWAPRYTVAWPNLAQHCGEIASVKPSKLSSEAVEVIKSLEGQRYGKEQQRRARLVKQNVTRKRVGLQEQTLPYGLREIPDAFWRSMTK